jgi:hypothetical protein
MRNAFEWLTLDDKAEARFVDLDLADDHAPDPGPAILFTCQNNLIFRCRATTNVFTCSM